MRATFVCEATVGHVAFLGRLRRAVAARDDVVPRWVELGPAAESAMERVPPFSRVWTARASLRARRVLAHHDAEGAPRPDVLFFHTVAPCLLSIGRMRRVPTVISLDATPFNVDEVGAAYGHRVGPRPLEAAKTRLTRAALQSAQVLVAWSRWVERSLVDDYAVDPARVVVQPPGVPVDRFSPTRARAGDMNSTGSVRLLFVGADFARKGGPELLQAFAALPETCELDVVTPAAVGATARVRVHRDLSPDDSRLRDLYASADVFVLPTRADTWGHAVVEAMASGLPVVTTTVGALPEIVTDGAEGLVVRPGDVDGLGAALRRLVDNADLRARLGKAGRRRAEEEFDGARNLDRIVDLVVTTAGTGGRVLP